MVQPQNKQIKSAIISVLAIKEFRHLWFGQICSNLAMNTTLFVLALIIYQLTGSNAAVSGLFLAYGLPAMILGLAAGTAVDHLNKRMVLLACDFTRAILTLFLFFLSNNLLAIYIITLLNAIVTQFYAPAEAPTLPKIVPKDLLVAANGLFSFTYFSSLAVGSILAGPILRVLNPEMVYLFMVVLLLLAAWNVWKLKVKGDIAAKDFERIRSLPLLYLINRVIAGLVEGIKYIRQSKDLTDALMLLTGTQIILALLAALGPGLADRVLEIDIRDASLVIVGPAVLGIVFGALWVSQNAVKINRNKLINFGVGAAGILLIIISVTVRLHRETRLNWFFESSFVLPFIVFLFFCLGVANSFLDVPANSILQEKSDNQMRGRVYGMLIAAVGGVGIMPVILGGILADNIGVGRVIFILGVLITLYGIWRYNSKKFRLSV